MGRSSLAAAALAASATAVSATDHGLVIHQERYASYYGKGVTAANFFTAANPLIGANPSDRIPAFVPSASEISFIEVIDFPQQYRPVETRIFSGVIDVTECFDGDYIFRITSDDAAHLIIDDKVLIDNGGEHGPTHKWAHVKLERGNQYNMQLWWGNAGGGSSLKLEYCRKAPAQSKTSELMNLIHAGTMGGVDSSLFSDADLALEGCHFTTDIEDLFLKHELPTITRSDYKGYHGDDIKFFDDHTHNKVDAKWLPSGHAHETGGVIAVTTNPSGVDAATNNSFKFEATIAPRVTGQHTFWVESDDGGFLLIDGGVVVDNRGAHGALWRKASIFLKKGQEYKLEVLYGNGGGAGSLKVMWQDTVAAKPMESLEPILV